MSVRFASFCASAYFPPNNIWRISGKTSSARGLSASCGAPDQRESSLSWMRSVVTPPKTMAPRRPLPMGVASFQFFAGCLCQTVKSPAIAVAIAPVSHKTNSRPIKLFIYFSTIQTAHCFAIANAKAAVNTPQSRRFARFDIVGHSRSVWTAVTSAPL